MASLPFSISNRNRAKIAQVTEEFGAEYLKSNLSSNIKEIPGISNRIMTDFVMPGSSARTMFQPTVQFGNSYFNFGFIKSLFGSFVFANKSELHVPLAGIKAANMGGFHDVNGHQNASSKLHSFLKGPFIKRILFLSFIFTFIFYMLMLVFIYPPYRYQMTSTSLELCNHECSNKNSTLGSFNGSFLALDRKNEFLLEFYASNIEEHRESAADDSMKVSSSVTPHYSAVSYRPSFSVSFFDPSNMLNNFHSTSPFCNTLVFQCMHLLQSTPTINILYLCELFRLVKEKVSVLFPFSYLSFDSSSVSCFSSFPPFYRIEQWFSTFWDDPDDPEDPPFEIVFSLPILGLVRLSFDVAELDQLVIGNPFFSEQKGKQTSILSLSRLFASATVNVNLSTRLFERSLASIRCLVQNATLFLLQPTDCKLPVFDILIPDFRIESLTSFEATRGIFNAVLNRYQYVLTERTQKVLSRRLNRSLRVATKKISRAISLGSFLEFIVSVCLRHPLKFCAENIKLFLKGK
ncbi:hypothetical protein MDAP_002665 [Mitosporidium daphniae]|uniref:Uncharacterized protein n=1 Tax=Mitosporidium daphniae TaxID=1485682 RepID=A0A098VNI0_9MICR|nr:uncharacterized protein DI09_62p170 [Mitosporidium daphniae]KGG50613.1 hypothetical protein DI09_62p170 [Mitosporidium daphniae]|eukprot:XP_013237040.1 uncharacterized protein DI09_62p170 [Mitosporidium daphniae]